MAVELHHAYSPHYLGEIASWYNSRWLVINAALETSWRPINKLNGTFGFDCCHGCIHILGNHITTIHHAASHVLTMARVTFYHLRCGSKTEFVISATDSCSWYAFSA